MKISIFFLVPALSLVAATSGCVTTYRGNKGQSLALNVYEKGGTLYLKNADYYAQKQPAIPLLQITPKTIQDQSPKVQYGN